MEPAIELRGVTKCFGSTKATDGVTLTVRRGELVSLLGPSGCGKTTTLNMVAGFLEPDEGEILVQGTDMRGRPPFQRNMGMVFQNYSLFPHMTVFENIAFGLRVRRKDLAEIQNSVEKVIKLVRLEGLERRYPRHMSGGQQQRVALARALVYNPHVLLLDEPLSNLDAKLRIAMREEIVEIQKKTGITTLFVTHDQEEAIQISDRILVMHGGRVEQEGTPEEIYRFPQNYFVADFLGEANFQSATVLSQEGSILKVETLGGDKWSGKSPQSFNRGDSVRVMIRPENIQITGFPRPQSSLVNKTSVQLRQIIFLGSYHIWEVGLGPTLWKIKLHGPLLHHYEIGNEIPLHWSPDDTIILKT